jgi:SAM-dependent methyltransferase
MTMDAQWLGDMPEAYDRVLAPALFAPFAAEVATRAAALSPVRVLELAAGTGVGTAALVAALPGAAITATDVNSAMVSWGAGRVPAATWRKADAQRLEFPVSSFDLVVCQFGVMFFPDKVGAYAESARVLTPGGWLLLTVWDSVEGSTLPAALVESLAAVLPDDTPSFLPRVPHGYADPVRMRADLEAGALLVQSIERLVLSGEPVTPRRFAEGFCNGTPLRFALEERGSLTELTRELGDEMTARLGTAAVSGALTGFVVTAHKPESAGS